MQDRKDIAVKDAVTLAASDTPPRPGLLDTAATIWQATRRYWIALAVLPTLITALAADSALFGEHWIGYVITSGFALLPGIAAVGVVTTFTTCWRVYMAPNNIASPQMGRTVSPGEPTPVTLTDVR